MTVNQLCLYLLTQPYSMSDVKSEAVSHTQLEQILDVKINEESINQFVRAFHNAETQRDDEEEIVKWVGDGGDTNYCRESKHYENYESSIMRHCIVKVLERDFEICDYKWFQFNHDRVSTKPALFESKEVQRGVEHTIPRRVVYFLKRKGDESLWAVRIFTWDDDDCEVVIHTNQSHKEVQELWNEFKTYFVEHGPLKGECFTPEWKWVDLNKRSWSDVILTKPVREELDLNVVDYINNMDSYMEYGLPTNRGVLFAGEPGTGKTLTLEVLLNQFEGITRIYATAETLFGRNHIRKLYGLARKLSPTIVAIEDIDTIGSSDEEYGERSPLVGEILTALNCAENNNGVVTIATTNYPDNLDIALRDRPGRFDSRIDFDLPDKKGRKRILKTYIDKFDANKQINMDLLAKDTDGFTGAWLREVVLLAFSLSLKNTDKRLNQQNIDKAVSKIKILRQKTNRKRSRAEESEDIFG